ncbi:MAG: hypothetical protein A2054_06200 [Deltaproteobacteria bacterium GWA2_55_10]|nr:MAG: hypothetical protein A2054_06200 [Deltaproteobacteria bacterium GWA2_55_10]
MKKASITVLSLLMLASCSSLSTMETNMTEIIDSKGYSAPSEKLKDPTTAAALNVLPGFGNFYLAYGTKDGDHWVYGLVNMALWPYSIIWSVPEAYIDAPTVNKKVTVDYYVFGPGREDMKDVLEEYKPTPSPPPRVKTVPNRMLDNTSTY